MYTFSLEDMIRMVMADSYIQISANHSPQSLLTIQVYYQEEKLSSYIKISQRIDIFQQLHVTSF